jgi:hypothetical protein
MERYHELTTRRDFDHYYYDAETVLRSYEIGTFEPPDPDAQPLYEEYIKHMYKTDQRHSDLPDHSEGSNRDYNPPLAASKYSINLPMRGVFTPFFWGEQLPWVEQPTSKLEIKHMGWGVIDKEMRRFVWLRRTEFHAIALVIVPAHIEYWVFIQIPKRVAIHPKVKNCIMLRNININYTDEANTIWINVIPKDVLYQWKKNQVKRVKLEEDVQ